MISLLCAWEPFCGHVALLVWWRCLCQAESQYLRSFETMPSQPSRQAWAKMVAPGSLATLEGFNPPSFSQFSPPLLHMIGEPVIAGSNCQHLPFGFLIIQKFCDGASLLAPLPPVLGIVNVRIGHHDHAKQFAELDRL